VTVTGLSLPTFLSAIVPPSALTRGTTTSPLTTLASVALVPSTLTVRRPVPLLPPM
jgi:hypothetical protein